MESNNKFKSAMVYGLYLGLALVFMNIIQYVLDVYNPPFWVGLITYAVVIAGIVFGQYNYRDKELGGFISYGQSLGFGVLISLFASVIFGFYFAILIGVIDPSYMDKMMEVIIEKYQEAGLTDDQIDAAMDMVKKFQNPIITVITSVFSFVFMGTLFSLITSIFIKKEKPLFE